jgi:hypothetical protein
MRHMKPNKEQDIPTNFWNLAKFTKKTIRYNNAYMDHELRVTRKQIDFMNIITHPTLRVILRSGESAIMRCVHPNEKLAHLNNLILMVGSPYGLVVMYGLEKSYYETKDGSEAVIGPIPTMHATTTFWMMFRRFVQRTGRYNKDVPTEGIMKWVLSKDFRKDIQDQVQCDKQAGLEISDGLPAKPPRPAPKPKQSTEPAAAKPAKPANRRPEGKKSPKVQTYPPLTNNVDSPAAVPA